jgi:Leucine-rich repeat (LRR) protein
MTVMANTRHLSQVRSLNIVRGNIQIPNLGEFKFLRLLFLDVDNLTTDLDLTGVNHLSQLRYLKVAGGHGNKVLLPAQIWVMRLLETLDLSDLSGDYTFLPPKIVDDVPHLSHVSMPWHWGGRLPDGIGKAKSLITLEHFNLAMSSLESITGLGELTALSKLVLTFKDVGDTSLSTVQIAALITSLEKLGNLKAIELWRRLQRRCHAGALIFSSLP